MKFETFLGFMQNRISVIPFFHCFNIKIPSDAFNLYSAWFSVLLISLYHYVKGPQWK